ncbi:MAG: phosphatase PAP2 family protein [Candidatus Pacearchaeota archaeon]
MKDKKHIWVVSLIVIAFILALYFDSYIIQGVTYLKNAILDEFLIGLTYTSTEIIIFFVITSFFLWNSNKRKWILPLWFTLLLSSIASFILKLSIQRPRPFQQGLMEISSFLVKDSYYAWDFSFPSAQTMAVFCAVPFLIKEFPRLKYMWVTLAAIVGFSRIYFGFHFLSDVIAGAAIGWMLGALIIKNERESRFWEKVYWRIHNKVYDKIVK